MDISGDIRSQFFYSEDEARNHVEEPSIPRASPRSLQKEDSDSVWNELQHFKTEYEKLRNERSVIHLISVKAGFHSGK